MARVRIIAGRVGLFGLGFGRGFRFEVKHNAAKLARAATNGTAVASHHGLMAWLSGAPVIAANTVEILKPS